MVVPTPLYDIEIWMQRSRKITRTRNGYVVRIAHDAMKAYWGSGCIAPLIL
jgi:hypothetical protein